MEEQWQKVGGNYDRIWNPEEEKIIQGIYQEARQVQTVRGETTMYILLTPQKETVGIWKSTVLQKKFALINIGDEVKIEYIGKIKSKNGTTYKDFIFWRRSAPSVSATKETPTISTFSSEDEDNIFF